jgi:cytochrome P450
LTYVDCLRLHWYVTLPGLFGGSVAPNRYFWPHLAGRHATVATYQFLRSVRRKYGPRVWSWFPITSTLLVLDRDGIDAVLKGDGTFADPSLKKRALSRFTPSGVIISRGQLWSTRRQLNDAALAFGHQQHPDADVLVSIVNDEVQRLLESNHEVLAWDDFSTLAARISQQVIFGRGEFRPDFAEHLARLVAASNWLIRRYPQYWPFRSHIEAQLDRQAGTKTPSLVCRAADWVASNKDQPDADAFSQTAFWLFVMKDAIELHTVRTLALIANASADVRGMLLAEVRAAPATSAAIGGLKWLEACIKEQLRLWTPVPILLRVAVKDFELGGIAIRAGQQLLMHTGFYHRDPEVFGAAADRFSPEARLIDEASHISVTNSEPPLYVFSAHQQACAGQFLVIFLLKAVLAALLKHTNLALPGHAIDVKAVPAALDQFALRFRRRPHDV